MIRRVSIPLRLFALWVAAAAALVRAEAPAEVAARLQAAVAQLASDEFEGRGIGTEGLVKAQQYVREQFTAAGLNVVTAGGDPFQEFDVVDGAELQAPNTLEFRGPDGAVIPLQLGTDFQVCSFGEAGQFSAPLEFLGYGIESTDPAYDEYAGIDVQGKVVVLMRRTPQQGREQGLFDAGPHGTSQHAGIRTKVSNAFRRGAAAILFVNDPYTGRHEAAQIAEQLQQAQQDLAAAQAALAAAGPQAANLTELQEQEQLAARRVEQTELVRKEHKVDPLMEFGYGGTRAGKAVPILHISQAVCDRLLAAAGQPSLLAIEAAIDETGQPHSRELSGWTAVGETALKVKRVEVANVIGVLEGAGPLAEETIVIGAHYDHIGFGGDGSLAPNSKEIHNGADDNASGTAALIELARHYAARPQPPARRLVFIAFTGEERGLLGSAHYVKEPLFPIESTIAMFNMDMVGRLEEDQLTVFGTGTSPRWDGLLDQSAAPHRLELAEKPEGFGPSDHSSFYAKQIPVLHLFTGTHDDYHRPGDDTDKINFDGMTRITAFLEAIVDDTLANPERPQYIEIAERATLTRSGNRPYFGSIPDFGADTEGYALQGVAPGSPADLGGLRGGDVIVQLGEDQIGSLDDFDLAVQVQPRPASDGRRAARGTARQATGRAGVTEGVVGRLDHRAHLAGAPETEFFEETGFLVDEASPSADRFRPFVHRDVFRKAAATELPEYGGDAAVTQRRIVSAMQGLEDASGRQDCDLHDAPRQPELAQVHAELRGGEDLAIADSLIGEVHASEVGRPVVIKGSELAAAMDHEERRAIEPQAVSGRRCRRHGTGRGRCIAVGDSFGSWVVSTTRPPQAKPDRHNRQSLPLACKDRSVATFDSGARLAGKSFIIDNSRAGRA